MPERRSSFEQQIEQIVEQQSNQLPNISQLENLLSNLAQGSLLAQSLADNMDIPEGSTLPNDIIEKILQEAPKLTNILSQATLQANNLSTVTNQAIATLDSTNNQSYRRFSDDSNNSTSRDNDVVKVLNEVRSKAEKFLEINSLQDQIPNVLKELILEINESFPVLDDYTLQLRNLSELFLQSDFNAVQDVDLGGEIATNE